MRPVPSPSARRALAVHTPSVSVRRRLPVIADASRCSQVSAGAAEGPVLDAYLPPEYRRRGEDLPGHSEDATPSMNLSTLLTSIRLLMAHPNPDGGLVADIVRLAYLCHHAEHASALTLLTSLLPYFLARSFVGTMVTMAFACADGRVLVSAQSAAFPRPRDCQHSQASLRLGHWSQRLLGTLGPHPGPHNE